MGIAILGHKAAGFAINGAKVGGLAHNGVTIWRNTVLPVSFAQDSWATISAVSQAGLASTVYSIGDTKDVLFGDETIACRIIGFDHDTKTDGTGTAGMTIEMSDTLSQTYRMHTGYSNACGWHSSEMRTTSVPAILATMPADLVAVMVAVNKKASSGYGSSTPQTLLTSSDTFFLLAEKEVISSTTTSYSMSGEGTRYAYYATGASQVKTRSWWFRSAKYGDSQSFLYRSSYGVQNYYAAATLGFSAAFCV